MVKSNDSRSSAETTADCRICLQSDQVVNLIVPCLCSGSQKWAHPACLRQWTDVKRSDQCGVCKSPYLDSLFIKKPDTFISYLSTQEDILSEIICGTILYLIVFYMISIGLTQYSNSDSLPKYLKTIILYWTLLYSIILIFMVIASIVYVYRDYVKWSKTHFIMEYVE